MPSNNIRFLDVLRDIIWYCQFNLTLESFCLALVSTHSSQRKHLNSPGIKEYTKIRFHNCLITWPEDQQS